MNTGINPAALSALLGGDLENAIVASTPGGIEAQEAQGQRDMAAKFDTLPTNMNHVFSRKLGFNIKEEVDNLFVSVDAPDGWFIRPTEHSMHSDIIDDRGRERGSIFYKASFYDRNASGNWFPRYHIRGVYPDEGYDLLAYGVFDRETNEFLCQFDIDQTVEGIEKWDLQDEASNKAEAWLMENYPDFRDISAYWS